ncbi:MAG: hypothetical protein HQL22_01700 [Candidatus Omnitrophica bacterium]|nr:hypothetical protein [Candidatus Omnitrophota bacterium]
MQIVGVVLAPFTGGASLMLTYIGMAISGYNAYRAGREQFNAWLEGTAIGLVVGGMVNSVLGASIASFYGGGLLGSTLAGATMGALSGAISGGITAAVLGGNWAQGDRTGGISGAAAGGASGYSSAVARALFVWSSILHNRGRFVNWGQYKIRMTTYENNDFI